MWGQICTESTYQLNFNFGFSTHKSDVLLHLSQWQYWWWFWFSFFWTFYYFVIIRTVKNRVTKMNPKFNTSLRGRGKWGDFLIAVLPLSWCANILLNSNFILRMFEWQNESSLFTLRIHGKQWYWIYKFDLIDVVNILTVPKNMGRNRWVVGTPQEIIVCESYTQAMQLRAQKDWIRVYWLKKIEDDIKSFRNIELNSILSTNKFDDSNYFFSLKKLNKIINLKETEYFKNKLLVFKNKLKNKKILNFFNLNKFKINNNFFFDFNVFKKNKIFYWNYDVFKNNINLIFNKKYTQPFKINYVFKVKNLLNNKQLLSFNNFKKINSFNTFSFLLFNPYIYTKNLYKNYFYNVILNYKSILKSNLFTFNKLYFLLKNETTTYSYYSKWDITNYYKNFEKKLNNYIFKKYKFLEYSSYIAYKTKKITAVAYASFVVKNDKEFYNMRNWNERVYKYLFNQQFNFFLFRKKGILLNMQRWNNMVSKVVRGIANEHNIDIKGLKDWTLYVYVNEYIKKFNNFKFKKFYFMWHEYKMNIIKNTPSIQKILIFLKKKKRIDVTEFKYWTYYEYRAKYKIHFFDTYTFKNKAKKVIKLLENSPGYIPFKTKLIYTLFGLNKLYNNNLKQWNLISYNSYKLNYNNVNNLEIFKKLTIKHKINLYLLFNNLIEPKFFLKKTYSDFFKFKNTFNFEIPESLKLKKINNLTFKIFYKIFVDVQDPKIFIFKKINILQNWFILRYDINLNNIIKTFNFKNNKFYNLKNVNLSNKYSFDKIFQYKTNNKIFNFFDYQNSFNKLLTNVINKKSLFYDITEFYMQIDEFTKEEDLFLNLNLFEFDDFTENIHYNDDQIEDTWDLENNIKHQNNKGSIRITKHFLTQEYFKDNTDLLKFNFYNVNDETALKVPDNDNFWVLKQKRYKKKQAIKPSSQKDLEYLDFETVRNIYKKHIIENIKLITDLDFLMDPYALYKCIRGNRHRTESLPIHLYRRLLRTKRTLVLPAHVNITVVTNSYDVVHSWFLPGIGLKMDCVPGRSTHHSLYLDNIGFFYGQCAEICGRYHHHMPIRVCALPFEHFLVWWQLKGLPKMLRLKKTKKQLIEHTALKYSW